VVSSWSVAVEHVLRKHCTCSSSLSCFILSIAF